MVAVARVGAVAAAALVALATLSLASAAGGDLDPTFGDGGRVVTRLGAGSAAMSLALQPNGKIVVAGVAGSAPVLVRYEGDGALDPTFGVGGRVPTVGVRLALQRDGKIVV